LLWATAASAQFAGIRRSAFLTAVQRSQFFLDLFITRHHSATSFHHVAALCCSVESPFHQSRVFVDATPL
jgi:hypothetical protein